MFQFATVAAVSFLCFSQVYAQSQQSIKGAWAGFSEPEIMASGFTHKFSDLPLEGIVQDGTKGWSGPYWASFKGGVNLRWNSPNQEGFNYSSPSLNAIKSMSQEELSRLSATEKYDLYLGNYDYPLKTEATGTASPHAREWAGICHGWAPASLHHNEPTPKVMTNPDGLKIPFGSSDIKALVSYYYAFYFETDDTNQVGLRCYFGGWLGGARACNEDLNAGALHIVMGNMLGIRKEGFLGDVDRYKEVWNQPIVGYRSKVLAANLSPSSGAASGTVKEMRIATEFLYVDEADPTWNVVYNTPAQKISKKDLVYRIELSAEGKIIGGTWESEDRPDFIWNKPKVQNFEGIFSKLPNLLND